MGKPSFLEQRAQAIANQLDTQEHKDVIRKRFGCGSNVADRVYEIKGWKLLPHKTSNGRPNTRNTNQEASLSNRELLSRPWR